jgi:hypothetical protein
MKKSFDFSELRFAHRLAANARALRYTSDALIETADTP